MNNLDEFQSRMRALCDGYADQMRATRDAFTLVANSLCDEFRDQASIDQSGFASVVNIEMERLNRQLVAAVWGA